MSADRRPLTEGEPPSVVAARRSGARTRRHDHERAYPLCAVAEDAQALNAELAATRALVRAESAADVSSIVWTLVDDLGGALVPARYADPAMVIPIDVSLGRSEPLLPYADPVSVASLRLSAVLPEFLDAARLVMSRIRSAQTRADGASTDPLTGLLDRRAWLRRLSFAAPGDSVCLIDLDHVRNVNDTGGPAIGDAVLRAVGALLARSFRQDDACGRYGDDELVCLTPEQSASSLADRCDGLRDAWDQERPVAGARVGLSIGVAQVDERGGQVALQAADAARYRAKSGGRNKTVLALHDYPGGTP